MVATTVRREAPYAQGPGGRRHRDPNRPHSCCRRCHRVRPTYRTVRSVSGQKPSKWSPMFAMKRALDEADIDPLARGVGKIIADRLNAEGECYFGRAYLVRHGIYQARAVRALKALSDAGLLVKTGRLGPHGTPMYRFPGAPVADLDESPKSTADVALDESIESPDEHCQVTDFSETADSFSASADSFSAPADSAESRSLERLGTSSSSEGSAVERDQVERQAVGVHHSWFAGYVGADTPVSAFVSSAHPFDAAVGPLAQSPT